MITSNRRSFLLGILGTATAGSAFRVRGAEPAVKDVSDVVQSAAKGHNVPGMVAAVIEDAELSAHGAWGLRRRDGKDKFTVADKVHLGSDTKAMTATLCAMLVQDGKLAWDTTLAKAFPKQAAAMLAPWRDVTLTQLLTHRAGCPGDLLKDPVWAKLWRMNDKPVESRAALLQAVTSKPPEAAPGTQTIYSNAGFSIAGHMAETLTGNAWETLIRKRLFEPLGMKSVGYGAPLGNQPWGHDASGKPVKPGPAADNPTGIAPAGRVHCTIDDWAKFVTFHLTRGSIAPNLLKPEMFDVLHKPVGEHAMGWIVTERPWAGGTALTHAGSNTMWYCVAWLAPKKKLAVLAATNQGGDDAAKACDDVCGALIVKTTQARR